MTRAEQSAAWIIDTHEGGWSDHGADRGGRTSYGITEAVARKHGLDVRSVTRADAIRIVVADYWSYDWCKSDHVATKILDIAVNCGPGTAARLLQRALRLLGHDIVEDGAIGPATKAAANRERGPKLLAALSYVQAARYVAIAEQDPTQRAFIGGWLVRAVTPINT